MSSNHFLEKIQSIMLRVPVWLIGLLGASIFGLAVVSNLFFERPDLRELTANRSMAFHGGPIEKPLQQPSADEILATASASASLGSVVVGNDNLVQISFWYRCKPTCSVLSLNLEDDSGQVLLEPLVHHPMLENIDWTYSTDESGLTLYQKVPKFDSIAQVLAEAEPGEVLVEEMILEKIVSESDFQILESNTSLNTVGYIITAREPTNDYAGWHSYKDAWNIAALTDKEISQVRVTLVQTSDGKQNVEVSRLQME